MLRDKEIDISLGIDKLFDRETAIAARHRELSAEMLTETDPAMLAAHTKQQAELRAELAAIIKEKARLAQRVMHKTEAPVLHELGDDNEIDVCALVRMLDIEDDEPDAADDAAVFDEDVDAGALGDGGPEDTEPEAAPLAPRPALVKIPCKRDRPAAGPAPAARHKTDSPNCAFCGKLDDGVSRTCKKCPAKFHHCCVIERYGEDDEDLCPRCHPST
jgi:hypothetical protein